MNSGILLNIERYCFDEDYGMLL